MPLDFSHFVFVDFENAPSIDLTLIEGKAVHVMLLIGEKQKRLDFGLVRQIHSHAAQVSLVEVGASGRNALDLVLAAYLGQAIHRYPTGEFTIVSGDKDFDPLVAHFSAARTQIARVSSFSILFDRAKPSPALPGSAHIAKRSPAQSRKPPQAAAASAMDERAKKMEGLIERLSGKPNRPKTRISLLRHVNTVFGQKLTPEEQERILDELIARNVVAIADGKGVTYLG